MKKALTLLLFSFQLFGIDLKSPQGQLIEPELSLKKDQTKTLRKWAKSEFFTHYKNLFSGDKSNEENMYKIFSLYKFLSSSDEYADTFVSAMNETLKVEKDAALKTKALNILKELSTDKKDHQRIAWYFYDYLASTYKSDKNHVETLNKLPNGNWSYILPGHKYTLNTGTNSSNKAPTSILKTYDADQVYKKSTRKFKRKRSNQNGLIIITLSNGKPFGMAAEISTEVQDSNDEAGEVYIDQRIGLSMKRSLTNAMMAIQKRYPSIEAYKRIMVSFDEREAFKDGNSAGVAFTLSLLSLLEDQAMDNNVAVTGVILPDCGVKAVGGVASKIRGACQKGLSLVVIPEDNKEAVEDLTLIYELSILWNIQIFSAENLNQVLKVSLKQKDKDAKAAIEKFNKLALILNKGKSEIGKQKSHLLKELDEIIKLAPNHESAKVLKKMLTGQRPKYLTLNGSVNFIFMMIERTLGTAVNQIYETHEDLLKHNKNYISKSYSKLAPEARALSSDVVKYIDSLIKFRRLLIMNIDKKKSEIQTALNLMKSETKKMEEARNNLNKKWEILKKKL